MSDSLGSRGRAAVAAALLATAVGAQGAEPAQAGARTHTVLIEGMQFRPQALTVRRGDRIVWRNKDLVPHTATAAGAFDSGTLEADGSWTLVVRKAGVLPYVCTLHPMMKGTLTVQ